MKYVKKFGKYLNEAETSSYAPPKYLVSPALAQDGSGEVDDSLTQFMEEELAKSKSYYKPGIRSANPPKSGEEVDRNLDEANININAKPKTRPFNKVKPGNVGLDFYDRIWTVIGTGKYSELEKFDTAGLSDGFENDDDCVAVKSDDRLKTAVYSYGEDGFRVFEEKEINEGIASKELSDKVKNLGDFFAGISKDGQVSSSVEDDWTDETDPYFQTGGYDDLKDDEAKYIIQFANKLAKRNNIKLPSELRESVNEAKLQRGDKITIEFDDEDGDYKAGDYTIIGGKKGGKELEGMGIKIFMTDKELNSIEYTVNEAKEISKGKIDMMGSKILNRIKIGAKFVTDGGDYTVTGFGPKSNAFQEYEAEKDGKPCKVKLTAMYGVKLEVTDDPRSAVYRKEEMLNSIILESVNEYKPKTNMKMVKSFSEYNTINENRFKQGKEIFGYKIEKNRPKLKPEVIATLADVVKEFTEAYKSIEDRDRNIFDLTDAFQKEIERFDKAYWNKLSWDEETIASRLVDAFRNGIKAQKPSMTAIKAMLSELPLDSGWG